MNELIVGKVYRCSDGDVRKLTEIEEKFLHYAVPIDKDADGNYTAWMELGRTLRWQVESKFRDGQIIG